MAVKQLLSQSRKIPFTQVANQVILDTKLSIKARYLYAYLYSKPDNWQFSAYRIAEEVGLDEKSVRYGLKELEKRGYLMRQKLSNGRAEYFIDYEPKANRAKSLQGKMPAISNIVGKVIKRIHVVTPKKAHKKMNTYNEDNFSDVYQKKEDIDGNPIPSLKGKKPKGLGPPQKRLDAEYLLKRYMALHKQYGCGEVPYYPKAAYLKQVYPVLEHYGLKELENLLVAYFESDNEIFKQNKWSISCFLSWKILAQLHE